MSGMWRGWARLLPLLLLGVVALPGTAAADTTQAIAQPGSEETGGVVVTVPLLGSPLVIDIVLDDNGNIQEVSLDPEAAGAEVESNEHRVRFRFEDGETKVEVKAKGSKLTTKVKTSSLENLLGPGSWSADLFGTGPVTVDYLVSDAGDGTPVVEILGIDAPPDVVVEQHEPEVETDGNETQASVKVRFAYDGYEKWLKIAVEVETGEDGDTRATLMIGLKAKDVQRLQGALEELVGDRTWTGRLCDGTEAAVSYQVTEAGEVLFVSATPEPFEVKEQGQGFEVRFGDRIKVRVELRERDGQYELRVRSSYCKVQHEGEPTRAGDEESRGGPALAEDRRSDRTGQDELVRNEKKDKKPKKGEEGRQGGGDGEADGG